ncbi:MAG TPA: hypothetical protein GXZ77_02460 [Papillibacter sp.]|nr:hypothetical protein [Papillibacter sp.]
MSTEVLVALLALAGTLAGSFAGIVVANKLVNYRLEMLEKKVEKHNKLIERVTANENEIRLLSFKIDDMIGDIDKCR